MLQAKAIAAMKRLVRFAHICGKTNKIIITRDKIIFNNPGLPKSVPFVFIPEIIMFRSATILHGRKQSDITTSAVKMPVTCEYFNFKCINVIL